MIAAPSRCGFSFRKDWRWYSLPDRVGGWDIEPVRPHQIDTAIGGNRFAWSGTRTNIDAKVTVPNCDAAELREFMAVMNRPALVDWVDPLSATHNLVRPSPLAGGAVVTADGVTLPDRGAAVGATAVTVGEAPTPVGFDPSVPSGLVAGPVTASLWVATGAAAATVTLKWWDTNYAPVGFAGELFTIPAYTNWERFTATVTPPLDGAPPVTVSMSVSNVAGYAGPAITWTDAATDWLPTHGMIRAKLHTPTYKPVELSSERTRVDVSFLVSEVGGSL